MNRRWTKWRAITNINGVYREDKKKDKTSLHSAYSTKINIEIY